MSDLREKFRKEEGITWYVDPELRGNPKYFRKQYVEWLEQRLERVSVDAIVKQPDNCNKVPHYCAKVNAIEQGWSDDEGFTIDEIRCRNQCFWCK